MLISEIKILERSIDEMKNLSRFEIINHGLVSIKSTLESINLNIPLLENTKIRVDNAIKQLYQRQMLLLDKKLQQKTKERNLLLRRIEALEKTSEDDLNISLIISKVFF